MDFIIGIGLLIVFVSIGGYNYFTDQSLDARTLIQLAISGAGSSLILAPAGYKKVKNLKIKIPNINPEKEHEDFDMSDLPECDDKSLLDFKCLHYLKHRAEDLGSKEALDLVIKLNTLLFSEECEKEDETPQPEVK